MKIETRVEKVLKKFYNEFSDQPKNPQLWKGNHPPDGRKVAEFLKAELMKIYKVSRESKVTRKAKK